MTKRFEVQVETKRLPLSHESLQVLRNLDAYDLVIFTSKNARKFFAQELRKRRIAFPHRSHVIQVGPRKDLLKFPISNKRILFPRSAIAPYDIVRRLRARGAIVRVMPLYTSEGVVLSHQRKELLMRGKVCQLYFKSPSGITGLLRQLKKRERQIIQNIPALCIGKTTARAARRAGFKKVSSKAVL